MDNLESAVSQFVGERDWQQFHSPTNLTMALSVEVSEIVEYFQWLTQEQSRNLPSEKFCKDDRSPERLAISHSLAGCRRLPSCNLADLRWR